MWDREETSNMAAALPAGFFFALFLLSSCAASELPPPHNVAMFSLNTNYTLRWDWDQSAAEGHAVTFTTEYISSHRVNQRKARWTVVCHNTTHRSCDLTWCDLLYRGEFTVRVRANMDEHHSDWVSMEFCPEKDAAVGPPSRVALFPAGSGLDVNISDPLISSDAAREKLLDQLYYVLQYWEGSADTQPSDVQTLNTSVNLVTLSNLKSWTWYCVKVQSKTFNNEKRSSFTAAQCVQTEGTVPWWIILLYFLASLLVCFVLVLIGIFGFFKVYKTVKATFFPTIQLPSHIKEYLCDSPDSDVPRLLSPDSESELLCEKVIICPELVLEVHHPPPEVLLPSPSVQPPETSGGHSRQGSGGSGDSGVYSTEGSGSGLRQPLRGHTSAGTDASWSGSFGSEQLKMTDMAAVTAVGAGPKSPALLTDEGVVDVCV